MSGQYPQAQEVLNSIIADPRSAGFEENVEFARILIEVYTQGAFESGLEQMQEYLDEFSAGPRSYEARDYIQRWAEILQVQDRITENPRDYASHMQLGYLLLQNRTNGLAEEHFLLALNDTSLYDAILGMGYACSRLGKVEQAVGYYQRYLEKYPEEADLYNQVGYSFISLNRLDDALKCFAKYKELSPDNPNAYDSYAECLMNMGRIQEAMVEYHKALEIDSAWSNALFMLGEIYRNTGDNKKAFEYYNRYLEMEPQGRLSGEARVAIEELKVE